jgi:signal transduction histidine kinase
MTRHRTLTERVRALDLQSKIVLVLVLVIVPIFVLVTLAQYQLARPVLEEEWKQLGISTGERIALKIVSNRWLQRPDSSKLVEAEILAEIYRQPSLSRIDVLVRDPVTGNRKLLASNYDEEPSAQALHPEWVDRPTFSYSPGENEDDPYWDIYVPIRPVGATKNKADDVLGMVHVEVTTRSLTRLLGGFWKLTLAGALASVVLLIITLSYFLRRTMGQERRLKRAEHQNLELSRQLHDMQRQLLNREKLAVMGQLTANFAHEIGTPLNAIGLHLQLLRAELSAPPAASGKAKSPEERVDIIVGEVQRIEAIVQSFLHTTSKPPTQRQLTDVNEIVDRSLEVVLPRLDALSVTVDRRLRRDLGPLRVVPLEIEQCLQNLLTNALDSIEAKRRKQPRYRPKLTVETRLETLRGRDWLQLIVEDNGSGIAKEHLKEVMKPFFTTKSPGEGTGLGLAITRQIVERHGGTLALDAKLGAWARVVVTLPYRQPVETEAPAS